MPQTSADLHLGFPCDLRCDPCDCRQRADPVRVRQMVTSGVARLTVRGGLPPLDVVARLAAHARARGTRSILLRAHGAALLRLRQDDLRDARLDGIVLPLFSADAAVHDGLAGQAGALADTLAAGARADAGGMVVEVEVPLLLPNVQHLPRLLERARREARAETAHIRVVPGLRWAAPEAAPWDAIGRSLAAALRVAAATGLKLRLRPRDGVPFCALGADPEWLGAFSFDPRRPVERSPGFSLAPACAGCAARKQCPGVTDAYAALHGDGGLRPFPARPPALYDQRTTPRAPWDDQRRRAAARVGILVLRPTVNCNQDCVFCSANETSGNVWAEHGQMLRAIARAARRGVQRLSFSGGEPTLSRHLPAYVQVARRLGMGTVEIVTNGVLLASTERVDALSRAGLTHAFVSLHAASEEVSSAVTLKRGDLAKTVQAIRLLLDRGVHVEVNHVVMAWNHRHLVEFVEFVHREFGGAVLISFAFMTPQYRGLHNVAFVPRLSDVVPHLQAAIRRAAQLGQKVLVGSRQGVPICTLGAYAAFSDISEVAAEAGSEDAHQKVKPETCRACRYDPICTGVWTAYADRHGLAELVPVAGPPITAAEIDQMKREFPAAVSEPALALARAGVAVADGAAVSPPTMLRSPPPPPAAVARSRPVRLVLVGTGARAEVLSRAAQRVGGIVWDGVVSASARPAPAAAASQAFASVAEALACVQPEGLVVAGATEGHFAAVREAIRRGIPVLVEKPVARTLDEAQQLAQEARAAGVSVMPVHSLLFAPRIGSVLAPGARRLAVRWRCTAAQMPAVWSRAAIFELAYHVWTVVERAGAAAIRPGAGDVGARFEGRAAPEWLSWECRSGETAVEVRLELRCAEEVLTIRRTGDGGASATWERMAQGIRVEGDVAGHDEREGGEMERLVAEFRDVVLGGRLPRVGVDSAVTAMAGAFAFVDALERAGAPFESATAPRHAASPGLGRLTAR